MKTGYVMRGDDLIGEALVDESTSELKSCSVELKAGDLILFDEDFTT